MRFLSFFLPFFIFASLSGDEFLDRLDQIVTEAIEEQQEIAGLRDVWKQLLVQKQMTFSGDDRIYRPLVVGLQGIIEQVFASELGESIINAQGMILTPMPATPLCTEGEISKDLVSPEIANDPLRRFTVQSRPTILRDYLAKGGYLFAAYPKGGAEKRTAEQLAIFHSLLKRHPQNLFDYPLNIAEIPPSLIGAAYQIRDEEGERYFFCVNMTQANAPLEAGTFGLWFGSVNDPIIQDRMNEILNFMLQFDP